LHLGRYIGDLVSRRIASLLCGDTREAWAARVAAARAADALQCSAGGAPCAVTQAGAVVAYRDGTLGVLLAAQAAASDDAAAL
jgi:hypothetical protein